MKYGPNECIDVDLNKIASEMYDIIMDVSKNIYGIAKEKGLMVV